MIRIILSMMAVMLTAGCAVAGPSPSLSTPHANMIRIEGVCIKIRNDAQYDEYFAVDFWRVDITLKDTIGHVYVGWNPNIKDDNRKWQRRKKEKSLDLPMIVPLSGEQAGEYLGIPRGRTTRIFISGLTRKAQRRTTKYWVS